MKSGTFISGVFLLQESNNVPELEEAGSGAAYNKDDFFDALSSDLKDRLSTGERPQRPRFSDLRKVTLPEFTTASRSQLADCICILEYIISFKCPLYQVCCLIRARRL